MSIFFCFSVKIHAEENLSAETGKSDQRGFETRIAIPEPDFLFSGSSSESIRFYFGVGFRNVKLQNIIDTSIFQKKKQNQNKTSNNKKKTKQTQKALEIGPNNDGFGQETAFSFRAHW